MKHKVTVALCVVALGVASVATISNRQSYDAQQVEIYVAKVSKQNSLKSQLKSYKSRLSSLQSEITRLQDNCNEGIQNYRLLTTLQRPHATLPDCEVR